MEMMKTLTAFYFSGTGNTRYITEYLCGKLAPGFSCEIYEIARADDAARKIRQADVILLAFPIYGSAPPIPMRQFVHKNGGLLRGKKILLIETQYFFSGDGAASLGRTVKKYGGNILGAEMFNMPNNLADCKTFSVKNGPEIRKKLARARKRADRFAKRILQGKVRRRGFSPVSHGVGYFCQRKFWWNCEASKRNRLKIDPARCVGCGLCAKNCPAENLVFQDGRIKPNGTCVLCYRCVNLCPRKAITLFGAAPPETQYKGPRE